MELTIHPLLHLVESNRNELKSVLTHHIDATVDYQFDLLKNTILKMILKGLINPLFEDTENELPFTQTTFTTEQSNMDHKKSIILNHSNDHLEKNYISILRDGPDAQILIDEFDDDDGESPEDEYGDDDETGEQIEINQDGSNQLDVIQSATRTPPLKGQSQVKCPIETTQVNSQTECDKPVIQQSLNNNRKNFQVKSAKRKGLIRSSKAVKKVRHQKVDEIDQEEVTKLKIITLKVNCTETGCRKILKSCKMWKKHLSTFHGKMPYKELDDNVRHNQHGHTEYPCIACAVECKSQDLLYKHWRNNHLAGKYSCSDCAFVANFSSKVRTHQRNNHRSNRFQCTHQGCERTFAGNRDLAQHQRIHNGDRPFVCAWDSCGSTFNQHSHAICHVRTKHFRLHSTVKEQHELNIIDERDPKVYVQVMS